MQDRFEYIIKSGIQNGQLQEIMEGEKDSKNMDEIAQFILGEFSRYDSELNTPQNLEIVLDGLKVVTSNKKAV